MPFNGFERQCGVMPAFIPQCHHGAFFAVKGNQVVDMKAIVSQDCEDFWRATMRHGLAIFVVFQEAENENRLCSVTL